MALTPASVLADYSSGIGTQGATLKVNTSDKRVGIGTTNPQGTLQVGTGITMGSGIITATAADFSGNLTVGGVLTYEDVTSVDSVGVITARQGINVIGGNVGIGTSVASTKLDVRGTIVSYGSTTAFTKLTNAGSIEIRRSAGGFIDFSTDDGEDFDCRIKQTSTNDLAFETGGNGSSAEALRITSGGDLQVTGTISAAQDYPTIRPTLDLNFAASKTLDSRIIFTRDGVGTFVDELGIVKYASNNVPRFDHDVTTGESLGLLIEEDRTNLAKYSAELNLWDDNGTPTVSIANTTAPDGGLADKITSTALAAGKKIDVSVATNTTYSVSGFIKPDGVTKTNEYISAGKITADGFVDVVSLENTQVS